MGEFYEPYSVLAEAGFEIVIATPNAQPAIVDPEGMNLKYWHSEEQKKEAEDFIDSSTVLANPITIADALDQNEKFAGIIVPGGQGVMVDLLHDDVLKELLIEMGKRDKPVGLICHAPALLIDMGETNPFQGRLTTSVSGFEEWYIETFVMGAKASYRSIGDKLEEKGYQHTNSFPGRSGAARDCNLVTSQNPFSGDEFNVHYMEALKDYQAGAVCKKAEM